MLFSPRHFDTVPSPETLTTPGAFVIGCNYWASHAGTHMWSDWQADVVDDDLRRLRAADLQVLRVFPLWPDFQPITMLYGCAGAPEEVRHGKDPLPDTPAGQAGLSADALGHFADFLDLLAKHNLTAIVALITGWMSGRLFVPPAIDGMNILTDPRAILWQIRFVRHFVAAFKNHTAIIGWDLGNESNCLGTATREEAWNWTATITHAIRATDSSRPVISGMHGLSPEGAWRMQDQGELTDLLTTHPYPAYTPHCNQDPLPTLRPTLHGTAESCYYADLGNKPCLCQEIGTLGPMFASEAVAADYARTALFSLWAHDCHGMLWWCANEQSHLPHAPYDWIATERELGLLRADRTSRPVLEEFTRFGRYLDTLPFATLPPRAREAVCILTQDQDAWGIAYSSFLLAKQAGFDLAFHSGERPLPEAELYLMPAMRGCRIMPRRRLLDLLERIAAGATLYLSLDDGLPSGFEEMTGLRPQTRARRSGGGSIRIESIPGMPEVPLCNDFRTVFECIHATVLATEEDGNPLFTTTPYGQGRVFFISQPLERLLTETAGAFHENGAPACWMLYRYIARDALRHRAVRKSQPQLTVTEHPVENGSRIVVVINHAPTPASERLAFTGDWHLTAVHYGHVTPEGLCAIPANDAVVFQVSERPISAP